MYDFILQLRRQFLQAIINEMSNTARPLLPDTLDEIAPLDIAGVLIHPVVNIGDSEILLAHVPQNNALEIQFNNSLIQLKVQNQLNDPDAESLYELGVNLAIQLPIENRQTDNRILIGTDLTALPEAAVTVQLAGGHPLADDEVLLELVNRFLQIAYANGAIPAQIDIPDTPFPNTPFTFSGFINVLNDQGGGNAGRTIRVATGNAPDSFVLTIPLEVWGVLAQNGNPVPGGGFQFTIDLLTTFPINRQLNNSPASIDVLIADGAVTTANYNLLAGSPLIDNPLAAAAIAQIVGNQGQQILNTIGNQTFDVFTLDEIAALVEQLVRDALLATGRFIDLWQTEQTTTISNATPVVLPDVLAIGINSQDAVPAPIEPFLAADRDFGVHISSGFFLEEINAFLAAPAAYEDIAGNLRIKGQIPAGSDFIVVDGFDQETGTIKEGTRFELEGSTYATTQVEDISNHQAGMHITPPLLQQAEDDDRIRFVEGFGVPRSFDAGGWDRELILKDLQASLQTGHIRLHGPFTLRRPHAIVKNIDGNATVKLGLDWQGSAEVNGSNQQGNQLQVKGVTEGIRDIPSQSVFWIDGYDTIFTLTQSSPVTDGKATLAITPDLPDNLPNGAMLLIRWRRYGAVDGNAQGENVLQIAGITQGSGFIPQSTIVRIAGNNYVLAEDTTLEEGEDTITLPLKSALEEAPEDEAAVRLFGRWYGKGIVDGPDQEGKEIKIRNLLRFVPGGASINIEGLNGQFTVTEEADIIDDRATVPLAHVVVDTISGFLDADTSEIWDIVGQPEPGAVVRIRQNPQNIAAEVQGTPEVELDNFLDGIIGIIIGVLVSVLNGSILLGVITGIVSYYVVRAVVRALGGKEVENNLAGGLDVVPFPEELANLDVGVDTYFNRPIEITPDGLIISGSAIAQSNFPSVMESRALIDEPFNFAAGLAQQLNGKHTTPDTSHLWRFGDGNQLAAPAPLHTYPRMGLYVAGLTNLDEQWGVPIRTRHLTKVRVSNSLPELDDLPQLAGKEGEEIELSVSFRDVAWLDSHQAFVDFGDGALPEVAQVTEVKEAPATTGTLTALHTYCDNGTFTVTVILKDQQGGEARKETTAVIENVPPLVDAGEDRYSHPCVPLRLVGYFEDIGWCDTHQGTWDFGDCTPLFPATIEETHQAPKATGCAIATHCYKKCGTYLATLTITDDDGDAGTDTLTVKVVDLVNGDFEGGFHAHPLGTIGNGWQAYAAALTESLAGKPVFSCEKCIVCRGQSAQGVQAGGYQYAGLQQSIGANPGWEYQFVVNVQNPDDNATVWMGIDPLGGTDRNAASIVWRSLSGKIGWHRLSNRAVAQAMQTTLFLEVRDPGNSLIALDCIEMQAYPCAPEKKQPEEEPEPEREPEECCYSWLGIDPIPSLQAKEARSCFVFSTILGNNLMLSTLGEPINDTKLRIPFAVNADGARDGLVIDWEGPANLIRVTVSGIRSAVFVLEALDENGEVMDTLTQSEQGVHVLEITGAGIHSARLFCDIRGLLLDSCVVLAQ